MVIKQSSFENIQLRLVMTLVYLFALIFKLDGIDGSNLIIGVAWQDPVVVDGLV